MSLFYKILDGEMQMAINLGAAFNQAARASRAGGSADAIANQLNNLQATMNAHWKSDEMNVVNQAIDKIEQNLRQQGRLLQILEDDIRDVALEIQREEELERQRIAEQLRREREEKERQAKSF